MPSRNDSPGFVSRIFRRFRRRFLSSPYLPQWNVNRIHPAAPTSSREGGILTRTHREYREQEVSVTNEPAGTSKIPSTRSECACAKNGPDWELLKCFVCAQFPPKYIFMCPRGHSVCSECRLKIFLCPICRVKFGTSRRNLMVETVLDSMRFECGFKEKGCRREGLSRQKLRKHERNCACNPERDHTKLAGSSLGSASDSDYI